MPCGALGADDRPQMAPQADALECVLDEVEGAVRRHAQGKCRTQGGQKVVGPGKRKNNVSVERMGQRVAQHVLVDRGGEHAVEERAGRGNGRPSEGGQMPSAQRCAVPAGDRAVRRFPARRGVDQ